MVRTITDNRFESEQRWLALGWVVTLAMLAARLLYQRLGVIELSEDEAYQWLWSKHLALSYFSKPPMIALAHWLGTRLLGDVEAGVRLVPPLLAAAASLMLLHFFRREVSARAGFILVLMMAATPLAALGAALMTVDCLSCFFWLLAMLTGWRAVKEGSTAQWLLTGLGIGLGFLSKYTALLQLVSWALWFAWDREARAHLRRRGPWLALGVAALCTLPVLIWNAQHGWVTVSHLADRAGVREMWRPTLRFLTDFLLAEAALFNPVFFAGIIWAGITMWRRGRRDRLEMFLFLMSAPLFLGYAAWSLRARVLPNWIAPAVLPLLALAVAHGHACWAAKKEAPWLRRALVGGLLLGAMMVLVMHVPQLLPLPAAHDPHNRVRGWHETAALIEQQRARLEQSSGASAFIIGDHYGIVGELSFYHGVARHRVQTGADPLVYYRSAKEPENQFYFWPGYHERTGQSAIYIQQTEKAKKAPLRIRDEFEHIEDLGLFTVSIGSRPIRSLQLFACRGLRRYAGQIANGGSG